MILRKYILLIMLSLFAFAGGAQPVIDTICTTSGPSHLAVAHQPGFHYYWNITGGSIISNPDSNDVLINWNSVPGFYNVEVSAIPPNGCGDTSYAVVFLVAPQKASISGPREVCRGSMVYLESNISSGFTWQGGKKNEAIEFLAEKDTIIFLVAQNANCDPDTSYHYIKVVEPPQTAMTQLEDTLQLNSMRDVFYTGPSANAQVDWYINGDYYGSGSNVIFNFNEKGPQEIWQVVSDGSCSDTLVRTVYIKKTFKLFIPNAFTPNGDGVNERFIFKGMGIARFEAHIYNRWGERVYSWNENNAEEGWDGLINGKPAPAATYVYHIIVYDVAGSMTEERGSFNLIR